MQEGARRGRVGAMHGVAAVRTLWMCGTEKCPCEFATEGASMGSEKEPRSDIFLCFLNENEFEIHNELT